MTASSSNSRTPEAVEAAPTAPANAAADAWIEVGKLGRPKGLRGVLLLHLHNPDSDALRRFKVVRLVDANGTAADATLDVVRAAREGAQATISLGGIDDRDAAAALVGRRVLVPRSVFPATTGDDATFFAFDLQGMRAIDVAGATVGEVRAIADFGAGSILVVAADGDDVFVPFAEPYVGAVDRDARTVVVDLDDLR